MRKNCEHYETRNTSKKLLINNHLPKAKWLSVNFYRDEVEVNIHW